MFSTKRQQQGFTLLEILITLAILAIITVFAVPSMQGILGGSVLNSATNDLVYGLQSARSEAIKRTTPVHLCPSKNSSAATAACGGSYTDGWIVYVDADSNGALSTGDSVILRNDALAPAFSVAPDPRFSKLVAFSLSGTSVNSAGIPIGGDLTITHAAEAQKRVVRIAANGRISTSVVDLVAKSTGADGADSVPKGGSS